MRLLHILHRAEQIGTELFNDKLNGLGGELTIRQAILLDAIRDNPGVTQTALVAATGIDRSTLSEMIKRMAKKGWATRVRMPDDDRAYSVDLTSEGRRLLGVAHKAATKAEADLVAQMPKVRFLAAA